MKVVLIDDDKLVCTALKTILEADEDVQVIAIGHNGSEAIALFERLQPHILLMDIRMDGMAGLEAGEIILRKYKNAKILFLTTFADDEYIIKALRIGAKGYILKQNFESIIPSLKAVIMGQSVFGEDIITKIPSLLHDHKKLNIIKYNLSEKELEIIRLVADGLNNKEIANHLYLSEGTIRNYLSIILDKLGLRDRTQLAIFYFKTI